MVGELARVLLSFQRPPLVTIELQLYRLLAVFTWREGCAKCFFSQSSQPNVLIFSTMLYDSVCLKDPHRCRLIRVLVSEYEDF